MSDIKTDDEDISQMNSEKQKSVDDSEEQKSVDQDDSEEQKSVDQDNSEEQKSVDQDNSEEQKSVGQDDFEKQKSVEQDDSEDQKSVDQDNSGEQKSSDKEVSSPAVAESEDTQPDADQDEEDAVQSVQKADDDVVPEDPKEEKTGEVEESAATVEVEMGVGDAEEQDAVGAEKEKEDQGAEKHELVERQEIQEDEKRADGPEVGIRNPVEENQASGDEEAVAEAKEEVEETADQQKDEPAAEQNTETQQDEFSDVTLPVVPSELTEAVSRAHTAKEKFAVLKKLSEAVEISDRDLVDTVFNLLVGGIFDLETNFIITDAESVILMVDLLESCSLQCQAEIWSKFKGICRKSTRNLHACSEAGLLEKLLLNLKQGSDIIAELLIDMLSLMTSYSITVKELKLLLSMLRGENQTWPPRAVQLLKVLQQTPERHGPDCFFMFPGVKDAAIALPPLKAWPYSNGFTFTTWFEMEPLVDGRVDVNKPYLYCFRNSKGLGYSGHFVGNYLVVTVLKAKDKGFQHCVKFEFKPNKWHMVTIVHIYNRWRTSELKCYANGQLVSSAEMNWCIGANEQLDKCFLGSSESGDILRVFCGKMAAVYTFSEGLNPSQVYAIYQLGPGYKNQFKFATESDKLLANHHRKVLYEDNKLCDSLMMAYNPKATDGQLCLESSPRPPSKDGVAQKWFVHSPHALMLHGVKAVVTHSIHCALHSVGGIDVLYPLFSQLNHVQLDGSTDDTVCLTILKFILQLMKGSVKTQQQILQGKGFLVIGHFLEEADKKHITMDVLEILLTIAKYLDTLQNCTPLLRQFCDHIFFNPGLWIHTDPNVQLALYTYLATEFVSSAAMQTTIRRVSTMLITMHSLKHYYWVVNPQDRSGIIPKGLDGPRPSREEILSLRAFILLFLKQLVTRSSNNLDDELQSLISYLITIHEDENMLDVVQLLVALLAEHSSAVAPVFDNHDGIAVIFKLLGSRSEQIRVHALKLLGYFLQKCSEKRKQELLTTHSLFILIGERLLIHADTEKEKVITRTMYNALYELMIEEPCTQVLHKPHPEPTATTLIRNPVMMKVIANWLRQFREGKQTVMEVRIVFLNDLVKLFKNSRENRRTLLQQSVWQDWMLSLSYLHPRTEEQRTCQQLVFILFRILLYHAVKLEWGGWRVWVDTLAIVHSKVTFAAHKSYLDSMYQEYRNANERIRRENEGVSAITGVQNSPSHDTENHDLQREQKAIQPTEGNLQDEQSRESVTGEDSNISEDAPEKLPSEEGTSPQKEESKSPEQHPDEKEESESPPEAGVQESVQDSSQEKADLPVERDAEDGNQEDGKSDNETKDGDQSHESETAGVGESDSANDKQEADEEAEKSSQADGGKIKDDIPHTSTDEEGKPSTADNSNCQEKESKTQGASVNQQQFSPGPRTSVFRIPEFKWSAFHLRLYNDLFLSLEEDMMAWKEIPQQLHEVVNSNDNMIFVHNTIHLISQMIDNIILACGGILPILSSATSPNYELDVIDSSQGLSMSCAWSMMNRLASTMDILTFSTTLNFSEIEHEKNMNTGGILRQCLRAACMCAVRNCFENRYLHPNSKSLASKMSVSSSDEKHDDDSVPLHVVVEEKDEDSEEKSEILSAVEAAKILLTQMSNTATPIQDHLRLLQDMDVNRLRSVIYRDMIELQDDSKQAQFLSLAVVYFVSVLMVSKYRDILDPESQIKLLESIVLRKNIPQEEIKQDKADSVVNGEDMDTSDAAEPHTGEAEESANVHEGEKEDISTENKTKTLQEILKSLTKSPSEVVQHPAGNNLAGGKVNEETSAQSKFHSFDRSVIVKSTETSEQPQIVSVTASSEDAKVLTNGSADHEDLPQINTLDDVNPVYAEESDDISKRLERSLEQLAPLLRDIFLDFSSYLTKVLLGSHGQELLNEGLVCMKSYTSVVELVMLLCSQEWQNSIQKNAGLAFIELINEGRLLCHSMKEHVVRVANEAEFILNKQRSEDVKKHAEFESWCAVMMTQQRTDERQCDMLISAAKHRDRSSALSLYNRITNIMTNKHGAWGAVFLSRSREFWKLDAWEDDTRRRRRFVRNPYGSTHSEASLANQLSPPVVSDAAVSGKFPSTPKAVKIAPDEVQPSSGSSDEDDESLIAMQDKEFEDLNGPVAFTSDCDLIAPGVVAPGTFSITAEDVFFEVNENTDLFKKIDPMILRYTDAIHGKWSFHEVRAVFSRKYLLQTTSVEIFLANRTSVMFNFPDNQTMRKVIAFLPKVGIGTGYGLPQTSRISLASPRQLFKSSNMTQRWQQREISNYEYLMFLNTISGRTYNDLNQYPVFPWILTNYESEELDLSLPSNYRDLSKPVGALNPKRKVYFESRFENWEDRNIPKFHYGTHYSNAAFTLAWLVRMEPFTSHFLNLQGGKFDHADRTFSSVLQSWKNCQRDSHDVKELVPEFFYLPEMFVNSNSYNFGINNEKQEISDVVLPPWAKSPDDFVKLHRMALESEIVSCQLHQWIDLIFGYKQRGPEAVRSTNVFYYLTYENAINLNEITDPVEKAGLISQITNFGQTPCQLLTETHSPRSSRMHLTPMMFKESSVQDVVMVLKFLSNSPVTHVAANTHPSLSTPAVVTCTQNLQFCLNKWNQPETSGKPAAPQQSGEPAKQVLPVEPDPLMNAQGSLSRRQISDMLDQSVVVLSSCFVITADNRFLISCGYWDRSIRIIATDTGKLSQVIFGHWDVVTCLVRSDTYIGGDCYIVSGSRDATLLLWYWNGRRSKIIGDSSSPNENPTPRAVLTGHDSEVIGASVCAELGLIVSASLKGPVLLHTITGDLLRTLQPPDNAVPEKDLMLDPRLLKFSSEGIVYVCYSNGLLCNFTMNGRSLKHRVMDDGIKAIALSADGEYLLTGGDKGILQVWDAWNLKHLYTYPQCDAGIRDIDISHDQKSVITGMTSGSIVVFRIDFNKWHHEYQNRY